MPAKRRCAFHLIVTSPPLPASTHTVTSPTLSPSTSANGANGAIPANAANAAGAAVPTPTSPGGSVIKQLPATTAQSNTVPCPNVAARIVGDCGFCQKSYCGSHRLPEHHNCANLQQCRDAAHAANKAKLESERTVARKVAST